MAFICDAHVHLYSLFHLRQAFEHAASNLSFLLGAADLPLSATRLLCLTERFDCHYFAQLQQDPGALPLSSVVVRECAEPEALQIELSSGEQFVLIAGSQIVTSERLELLSLCSTARIPDRLSFEETHQRIIGSGGVPVLNWAPGKWLFSRGKRVASLLESLDPKSLLLGDTWLRPRLWGEPTLMAEGRSRGFTVIAGSDPLPQEGEESRIGAYGIVGAGDIDPEKPVATLKRELLAGGERVHRVGMRGESAAVVTRLLRHELRGRSHADTITQPPAASLGQG